MNNLFKYIKVTDINPSLKLYEQPSDPETDAEERYLSSEDDLVTTDDEQDREYDHIRRQFVLSEIRCNKLTKENNLLKLQIEEKQGIIISEENKRSNLEYEIEELNKELNKKINEIIKLNVENKNNFNKKIFFSGILGFTSGIIVCYFIKN